MKHTIVLIAALGAASSTFGQVNAKGVFQVGLGTAIGGHSTEFEFNATYPVIGRVSKTSTDGAATVAFPIDLQAGLSNKFSLGLCLEPGRYIDSAGTHPNSFFILSLEPRYYVLNKDHFAVHLNLDLGLSALRIGEVESGSKTYDDTYAGGHFRLGAQAQYYFGSTFGLNFGIKYAAHNMKWRDRDPDDPTLASVDYEAALRTSGVQFQLGAQVKF